jgi:hypothetical protein
MAVVDAPAIIAELAQLRERAKAACEDARRLRYEQRVTLERIHARMKTVRAKRAELHRFLLELTSPADRVADGARATDEKIRRSQ